MPQESNVAVYARPGLPYGSIYTDYGADSTAEPVVPKSTDRPFGAPTAELPSLETEIQGVE